MKSLTSVVASREQGSLKGTWKHPDIVFWRPPDSVDNNECGELIVGDSGSVTEISGFTRLSTEIQNHFGSQYLKTILKICYWNLYVFLWDS